MKKFPFSAIGFQELTQELYALSDEQLAIEAKQIDHLFSEWVQTKFELRPNQIEDLTHLDERAAKFMANQTSFAVGNRLPVLMDKQDAAAENPDQGKIIYTKSSLNVQTGPTIGYQAGGELIFVIRYQS